MIHTRDLSPGYTAEHRAFTEQHVRDHLAAAADADDDPRSRAADVDISYEELPYGGLRIVGSLDAEPDAPYLRPGYDPAEAERNGL